MQKEKNPMEFYCFPSKGLLIELVDEQSISRSYKHYYCGIHDAHGVECPNCKKPLLRFLSLDTRDPRLELSDCPFKALPLLFCWTCKIAYDVFSYKILENNSIAIINYRKGLIGNNFPYEDYPDHFREKPIILVPIKEEIQDFLKNLNDKAYSSSKYKKEHRDFFIPQHQIGGEPLMLEPLLAQLKCSQCKKRMPLFASIGNQSSSERGFANNPKVQVLYFYCQRCYIISCFQQCEFYHLNKLINI